MPMQGCWVQLERSNMRLVLNLANMSKQGFLSTTIEKMQYRIKKLPADFQKEDMRGMELSEHYNAKVPTY
jgi:hypothetical protein